MGHPGAEHQYKMSPKPFNAIVNKAHKQENRHGQRCQNGQSLPHGLVGPRCTASVSIEGIGCESILDTGSQVTTVSETFYLNNLSFLPIQPICALFQIEGAGGQHVPYLGYIQAFISLPSSITGVTEEITSLVLIVPDCHFNSQIPLLIGTNVLDRLYQDGVEKRGLDFLQGPDLSSDCVLLFQHVAQSYQEENSASYVKLHGRHSITIPAGKKRSVFGDVRVKKNSPPHSLFVVESPETFSLPGGVFVESALLDMPHKSLRKIPVVLRNVTDRSVMLHPKQVIAEMMVAQYVMPSEPQKTAVSGTPQSQSDKLSFNLEDSPIPEQWKRRITEKLNNMPEVFAIDDLSHGCTSAVKHHIRLQDDTPFRERPRPIHPSDREAVKQHLRELLDAGIIRESESPFASPIVVVKKKNGKIRLCVDYRKLNMRTIKDAYALPNIEETFSALSGAKWFSVMDLKSGYYQVEVAEEDKHKTAFVCPLGFWEFNRMPQGVTNAPSTFQRLMEKCVGDLHLNEVLVFLDDLIVFSETLEEHEIRLMKVLNRLRDYGLRLSPDKCHFFKSSVKYLGHIVDAEGVHTDPSKLSALKGWPRPTNRKELKCFLGFAGYYRRFVEGYSKIAKPLNGLTAGYVPPRKRGKIYKKNQIKAPFNPTLPLGEEWTEECEVAFRTLIDTLTSAPVLAFANPNLPYVLHTDASRDGLGAALYQEQDGKLRVIAYASRGLSKSEQNYPAHKQEYLALKWAICEKFNDYLYGTEFIVLTDNNPLTYVLTTAKLDAAGHRWLAALSTYRFTIKYRAGSSNQDADGLSRRPQSPPQEDEEFKQERARIEELKQRILNGEDKMVSGDMLSALCQRHSVITSADGCTTPELPTLAESLALDASAIPDDFASSGQGTIPGMTHNDWYQSQREDLSIRRVISFIQRNRKPTFKEMSSELPEVKLLLREWKRLELRDGVLFRRCLDHGTEIHQLILPSKHRQRALHGLHDEVGHLGFERVLNLARARFYWPKMSQSIEEKCRTCERCVRRKANPQKAAPMENIQTSYPLELVCMDYLSIEPDSKDTRNVLVITDHFTKFAVATPTKDQKANTVAKTLWENFIVHYGFPSRLLSDQGRDFESHTIKELCSVIGAEKVRTTPYHPRGNPVERFNRTLLSMLGTLEDKDKYHWKDFVKPLVHAYNCTRNDTTGYSPYELMFGRQPRLPIDLVLGIQPKQDGCKTHSEYVKGLRQQLQDSYALASESSRKMGEKNKTRFDAKVRAAELVPGDRVLVRNVNLRGKHKLADRWEKAIHVVVRKMGDGPVYVVKQERGETPHRTLHRDLLLPCGFLPVEETDSEPEMNLPRRRLRPRDKTAQQTGDDDHVDGEMSSSDEEEVCYPRQIPQISTRGPFIQRDYIGGIKQAILTYNTSENDPCTSVVLNPSPPEVSQSKSLPPEVREASAEEHPESTAEAVLENSSHIEIIEPKEHTAADIPENGTVSLSDVVPQAEPIERDSPEREPVEIRRSSRERHQPDRLCYGELGRPLVLALASFFESLGRNVTESSKGHTISFKTHAETHAV